MKITNVYAGSKYQGIVGGRILCVRVDRRYKEDGAWKLDVSYGRGFQEKATWGRWETNAYLYKRWESYKQEEAEKKAHQARCRDVVEELNKAFGDLDLRAKLGWWDDDMDITGSVDGMHELAMLVEEALEARRNRRGALEEIFKN